MEKATQIHLIKILPLVYHHSHFLTATLDYTSFFTMAFLGPHPFFTAGLFWIRLLYGKYTEGLQATGPKILTVFNKTIAIMQMTKYS